MLLIRRTVVATCVALVLNGLVPLEVGLTFHAYTFQLPALLGHSTAKVSPSARTVSDALRAPSPRYRSRLRPRHRRAPSLRPRLRKEPFLRPRVRPTPKARLATRRARLVRRPSPRAVSISAPVPAAAAIRPFPPPPIQARAAFLVDMGRGQVLFVKNPDERLPMASTTKITTAVLALQHARLSDLVTVSRNAASIGESTMGLRQGERVTVRELLYGLLLNSGNDAAIALAEHVAGTEQRFVGMMNSLARSLHMWNTHYATPHGLDAPGHYTSARDLATITQYAMRDATFRQIVSTFSYHVPATKHNHEHWLASVNRVMYWYPGIDGVKPGDTDAAGLCQVVSVQRDGRRLLAVLLNTPTLVTDIRNLLNYGLQDFRWVQAPAWWDGPANSISGGAGSQAWTYYLGGGHYIRGLFLAYFRAHRGLETLGYPRTDEIEDGGQLVQYFQGGELVYDPLHRSVYPANLGLAQARALAYGDIALLPAPRVAGPFQSTYKQLGGHDVLGTPVTGLTRVNGQTVQFFQYGELASLGGAPYLVPLGDAELRLRGWLPAPGASDVYPPTMSSLALPPAPPVRRAVVWTRRAVRRRRTAVTWSAPRAVLESRFGQWESGLTSVRRPSSSLGRPAARAH